jgi:pyrimidine-nucleoside phosphorylase/thymidine phosphorylase
MRAIDIIEKKKKGYELSFEELDYIVNGFTKGDIPDYQMSAFLMTIYFNSLTNEETSNLTKIMMNSGKVIDLSQIPGVKVDKHSTGGVGDKISLIVIPLVSYFGIPVAKMSGRGLGHTGGTIDKLESIPGFRTDLTDLEFFDNVKEHKMAIMGQTPDITPADKKMYALRDVTSTVDSIPLIASSIMSKKLASGSDAIVLDVKFGQGAFMKTLDEARLLAQTMVDIGKALNRKIVAVITDMNEPLGHEIGNANEILEVVKVLNGNGAQDETQVALTIASHMCILGDKFNNFDEAYSNLENLLHTGKAIEKFKQLIDIQGGNSSFINNESLLPRAKNIHYVLSKEEGFVSGIDALLIGQSAMMLGAGRMTKDDLIDHSAGISLRKKVGDEVKKGDILCELFTNKDNIEEAIKKAYSAYSINLNYDYSLHKYIYDVIK